MIAAPLPANEDDRLVALHRYAILDTDPEARFDDLAQLASYICQTPMALISLVDRDRQWFKAKVGLNATETPRNIAFCAHAIYDRDTLLVRDTREDERFHDNPLVAGEPFIRFYAGVPLITADGHALGTLCVLDREPRQLDERQSEALHALSRQAIAQFELRRTVSELAKTVLQLDETHKHLREQNQVLSRDRADSASQQRAFLARAAHELRTPLTAIIGYTDLLRADLATLDTPESLESAQIILDASHHMLRLINNSLDLARLGLAITWRLCELLGGSIGVTSAPDAGSTFTVRLPRAAPS